MRVYLKFIAFIFVMALIYPSIAQVKNKDFKTKLKYAKKEAKEYEGDGWYVAPGDLPLEKQLENNYTKALEEDEDGYSKFVVGTGNAVAQTQSAAKIQAQSIAKLEIASQMSSQMAATIDNQIANNQIDQRDAATLQKMVSASKEIIATKIGRTVDLVEMYRQDRKTKNIECQVRIGYSQELAKQATLSAMKEQLTEDAGIAADKLDKMLGF